MNAFIEKLPVLIIGAGPVGLTLACDLFRRGIPCRLVDKAFAATPTSRATSLTPKTLEIFQDLGVTKSLLSTGVKINQAEAYQGDRLAFRLRFPLSTSSAFPYLLNNSQRETEQLLTAQLHTLGGRIERGKELTCFAQTNGQVIAQFTVRESDVPTENAHTEEIKATYLIGCDGARSTVRKQLEVAFSGDSYEETTVLGDVEIDWDKPQDKLYSWFNADGSMLAFPFRQERLWRLTATLTAEEDAYYSDGSLERLTELYRKRTGDSRARLTNLQWFSKYKTNQRRVNQYRNGRVFLAGDAAHIHSPAGGLGMNTGIQDAYNLGWKVDMVLTGQATDALLDTYQEERLPIAKKLLKNTGGLQGLYAIKNPLLQSLRNAAIQRLLNLNWLQHQFYERASQLDIHYRQSSLAKTNRTLTDYLKVSSWLAPKAGERAPDGSCYDFVSKKETKLYQQLIGGKFTLLLFNGQRAGSALDELAPAVSVASNRLGGAVQVVSVVTHESDQPEGGQNGTVLLDRQGRLHRQYGAQEPSLFLIRPDHYIGFFGKSARLTGLPAYLDQLLVGPSNHLF